MKVLSVSKQKKVDLVERLAARYSEEGVFVFLLDCSGLKAEQTANLRRKIRESGSNMTVLKNTLNTIALRKAGFGDLSKMVSGQIVAVFGSDCVGMAKIIFAAVDSGSIKLVAYSDRDSVYDLQSLSELAKLPSIEVLRAKLLGLLLSVPTKLVNVLMECPRSLVRILDSRSKKQ